MKVKLAKGIRIKERGKSNSTWVKLMGELWVEDIIKEECMKMSEEGFNKKTKRNDRIFSIEEMISMGRWLWKSMDMDMLKNRWRDYRVEDIFFKGVTHAVLLYKRKCVLERDMKKMYRPSSIEERERIGEFLDRWREIDRMRDVYRELRRMERYGRGEIGEEAFYRDYERERWFAREGRSEEERVLLEKGREIIEKRYGCKIPMERVVKRRNK